MANQELKLQELFQAAASRFAHQEAVLFDDGKTIERIMYGDLKMESQKVCKFLQGAVISLSHQTVGVCSMNGVHLPSILLGILEAGCSFFCLDPLWPAARINKLVRRLGVRLMMIQKTLYTKLTEVLDGQGFRDQGEVTPDHILLGQPGEAAEVGNTQEVTYVIATSGTTGEPKIVRVPQACIMPNITHLRNIFKVSSEDLVFMASALTFDPSMVDLFLALTSGATLLMVPELIKQVPTTLLSILTERHSVTVMQATPSLLASLPTDQLRRTLLAASSSLRVLALGGEPFPDPQQLGKAVAKGNQTQLYNLYGITEVSCWASVQHVSLDLLAVPLGDALEGTTLVIPDLDLDNKVEGEGQLFIGGGYRVCLMEDEHEIEKNKLRPSGDLVHRNAKGQLWYQGRLDRQVKRMGKRLNLEEIEMVVRSSGLSAQCYALLDGSELHVCVSSKEDVSGRLRDLLKQQLPAHYQPSHVHVMSTLPLNRHGKIDKAKLLAHTRYKGINLGARDVEDTVCSLWKKCLGTSIAGSVSSSDTFLASGGSSFQAVAFLREAEVMFSRPLPHLVEHLLTSTLAEVLAYIKASIHPSHCAHMEDGMSEESSGKADLDVAANKYNGAENDGTVYMNSTTRCHNCGNYDDSHGVEQMTHANKKQKLATVSGTQAGGTTHDVHFTPDLKVQRQSFDWQMTGNCQGNISGKLVCISRCNRILCQGLGAGLTPISTLNSAGPVGDTTGVPELRQGWKYDTNKCVDASPLIVGTSLEDAVVFIGSHSHRFMAIQMHDGKLLWSLTLADRIESSACLSACAKYVIVGCYDGGLYVINRQDRQIHWLYQTQGPVKSSPCLDTLTGLVLVGSHDRHLHAVNTQQQGCAWRRKLGGGSVFSSPCVHYRPHQVYAADLSGTVAALSPASGCILWTYNTGKPVFSSPATLEAGVLLGCVDGMLYHLSHQGIQLWTVSAGAPIFSSPSVWIDSGGTEAARILIASHDHVVYCITSKGETVWTFKAKSPVYSSPFAFTYPKETESEGTSPKGGESESTVRTESNSSICDSKTSTLVAYDLVAVSDTIGNLYIVNIENGQLVVSTVLGGEVFSSPVVMNGTVVIGCRDDFVYSYKFD